MNFKNMNALDIYLAGRDSEYFDYEKGVDALIEKDEDGTYIYAAGKQWKEFDYKKGLNALIELDKNGYSICYAGRYWKEFDYGIGLDAIMKKNNSVIYKFISHLIGYRPYNDEILIHFFRSLLKIKNINRSKEF